MSKSPDARKVRTPLRNLFRQEQQSNGGNPAAAFIAILDEVDQRIAIIGDSIKDNRKAYKSLTDWHGQVTDLLNALPEDLENSVKTALRGQQSLLEEAVGEKARLGAQEATRELTAGTEALRETKDAYEVHKTRLSLIATAGLPAALVLTLALGFLFGSVVIRTLPASWQWPCRIIGAQHVVNQTDSAAYCIIHKQ